MNNQLLVKTQVEKLEIVFISTRLA